MQIFRINGIVHAGASGILVDVLKEVVFAFPPRGLFSDLIGDSSFFVAVFDGVTGAAFALFRADARVARGATSFFSCRFPPAVDFVESSWSR